MLIALALLGLTTRVATSCAALDLIRDGGFEDGRAPSTVAGSSGVSGGWKWTSTAGRNPVTRDTANSHTGSWLAVLGGWGKVAGDVISQEVSIPAGANARLSFLRKLWTDETSPQVHDLFAVEIRDTSDRILTTLRTYSNLDADENWYIASLDVSAFAGQTVRVVVTSTENDSLPTALFIDDVYLAVTCGAPGRTLSVVLAGPGTGSVTSSPAGILCAGAQSCASVFPDEALITLSAVATPGSTFGGWQGACSGTGPCSVALTGSRGVTAVFNGPAPQSLDLSGGRIEVTIDWQSQYDGKGGKAFMIPQKDEFGFAYFTDPNNPEVFFKVLDFGGGKALCFAGGLSDFYYRVTFEALATGQTLVFEKPAGQLAGFANNGGLGFGAERPSPPTIPTQGEALESAPWAWAESGWLDPGPRHGERWHLRAAAALVDPQSLTLSLGRVQVAVEWRSQYSGQTGTAFAIPKKDEFGFFYFTDPNNPEVFVKVLDFGSGGALCFVGGLSDFYYKVTFRTLRTGQTLVFEKQPGDLLGFANNGTLRF